MHQWRSILVSQPSKEKNSWFVAFTNVCSINIPPWSISSHHDDVMWMQVEKRLTKLALSRGYELVQASASQLQQDTQDLLRVSQPLGHPQQQRLGLWAKCRLRQKFPAQACTLLPDHPCLATPEGLVQNSSPPRSFPEMPLATKNLLDIYEVCSDCNTIFSDSHSSLISYKYTLAIDVVSSSSFFFSISPTFLNSQDKDHYKHFLGSFSHLAQGWVQECYALALEYY